MTNVTVAQLIEWLKTFPEDAEVGFLSADNSDFALHEYVKTTAEIPHTFYDFTDSELKRKNDRFFNKKILDLGLN